MRYLVTLPANRIVSVYLSGEDDSVDTVLGIYDREGSRLLGENDDADEDTLSSAWSDLEVGAQPGQFTFEVRVKNITDETQELHPQGDWRGRRKKESESDAEDDSAEETPKPISDSNSEND